MDQDDVKQAYAKVDLSLQALLAAETALRHLEPRDFPGQLASGIRNYFRKGIKNANTLLGVIRKVARHNNVDLGCEAISHSGE